MDRSHIVYIPLETPGLFDPKDNAMSEIEEERQDLVKQALKKNGIYSLIKTKGDLPRRIIRDVLANGSSYVSIEVMTNSPRPYMFEKEGITQSNFSLFIFPVGFLFRSYCPWSKPIIRKSDQMIQAGIYVKIVYNSLTTPKEKVIHLYFSIAKC